MLIERYIGKEKDWESGLSDHGVRKYFCELGIFTSPDPLLLEQRGNPDSSGEKYYAWTPYQYSANNPISIFDSDGMGWILTSYGDDTNNDPIYKVYWDQINDDRIFILDGFGIEIIMEENNNDISIIRELLSTDRYKNNIIELEGSSTIRKAISNYLHSVLPLQDGETANNRTKGKGEAALIGSIKLNMIVEGGRGLDMNADDEIINARNKLFGGNLGDLSFTLGLFDYYAHDEYNYDHEPSEGDQKINGISDHLDLPGLKAGMMFTLKYVYIYNQQVMFKMRRDEFIKQVPY